MRKERELAVKLRSKGKTYSEIQKELGINIPKGTLSYWCRDISMSKRNHERIQRMSEKNLRRGRQIVLENKQLARIKRDENFLAANAELWKVYKDNSHARKIVLSMLYVAEGSKRTGSVMFGNSDANIIRVFLELLRSVFIIDESKFRVTVQCRADQDAEKLKKYWSKITCVPIKRFYKSQIDQRTVGKATKKENYMGVCRVDYFSAIVDHELKFIARTLGNR